MNSNGWEIVEQTTKKKTKTGKGVCAVTLANALSCARAFGKFLFAFFFIF